MQVQYVFVGLTGNGGRWRIQRDVKGCKASYLCSLGVAQFKPFGNLLILHLMCTPAATCQMSINLQCVKTDVDAQHRLQTLR